MAQIEDMHVDIEVVQGSDVFRIALIRSATNIVRELQEPGRTDKEIDAYYAALEFLQYQYETERTYLHHKEPK
jgi:hypothetical protein